MIHIHANAVPPKTAEGELVKVFISHDTALDYWRHHFSLDMEIGSPLKTSPGEAFAHTKNDVLSCYPELYIDTEKIIHVLVFDSKTRKSSHLIDCHKWTTGLPSNAFYGWGSFRISSPEFLFLQMASKLTIAQLTALGCELCGTYILQPRKHFSPSSFDECPERIAPLTNTEKIQAFINDAGAVHGIKNARRALKYVAEGSRSPMETKVYLQLCLPPMLGGYGLPKAELNPEIPLDEEARKVSGMRTSWGDICWPKKRLDVEYNGSVHSGVDMMRHDAGRALGIERMGWRVMPITCLQVFDIDKFEVVAKEIAAYLNVRLRNRIIGRTPARMALHEELDAWMSRV